MGRIARAAAAIVLVCLFAAAGRAQSVSEITASLEPAKLSLDVIEQAAKHGQRDKTYADLARRLAPLRDELHGRVDTLEPRLAQADARLKQLGEAPAANARPEDPAIAAERARIAAERTDLDAALKQARLLALRADELADLINAQRRALLTNRLLARSVGVFDPSLWRDAIASVPAEIGAIADLMRGSWRTARDQGGPGSVLGAVALLATGAVAGFALTRWWRRRLRAQRAETRFGRALAALIVLVGVALALPAAVIVGVLALESIGLLATSLAGVGYGTAVAVAVTRFGRGAALALLAPGEPERRLIGFHDREAQTFSDHLTWAAAVLGLAILFNVLFRATAAPVALTIAVSALVALAIVLVSLHLLLTFPEPEPDQEGRLVVRLPGLRVVLWLFVATVGAALVAGYINFAAFVAGRFVLVLAVLAALYVALAFIDALFTEVLNGDTEIGRALAALFGVAPRSLELVGTLVSAALRIVLVLVAFLPLLGAWGLLASDVFDVVQQAAAGIRVAGITISLAAVLTALVWLVLGILAARGVQRWLETRFMPRTGLDPGLQHSTATLIGWALLIAAIAFALAQLGLDLQKIALIAGALSVGIGFGLQSVVSNFVCGIILLAERPIRVGDWVVVKNEEGIVRRISVRATEIETFDRASVIIPNTEFITGAVKNLTHANTLGRVTVKVRAAYDSDVDVVRDMLIACACDHPQVLQTPPPRVFLMALGDIALEFELRCIVANVEYALTVRSDLQMAILHRFRAGGIKIPSPPHEARVPGGATN